MGNTCEKLTLQLLYLDHAFLVGHMFSVHEHMLCLVFVILLPNSCRMVNCSQNPYDPYLLQSNSSFPWSLSQLQSLMSFKTICCERGQEAVEHANICADAEESDLSLQGKQGFS